MDESKFVKEQNSHFLEWQEDDIQYWTLVMKRTMHMVDSSGNTEFIGSLALHVKKINFFLEKCVTYSPISEESGVIVPV